MAQFSDEMTRLAEEITTLRDERLGFLADLKDLTDRRRAEVCDIAHSVEALQKSTRAMQANFRTMHTTMGSQIKSGLAQFMSDLKRTVSRLSHDTRSMQSECHRRQNEVATAQKNELVAFVTELKEKVAGLNNAFHEFQDARTSGLKTEMERFQGDLRTRITGIKQTVAAVRGKFSTDLDRARQAWYGISHSRPTPRRENQGESSLREGSPAPEGSPS